jgi:hypothetical protein
MTMVVAAVVCSGRTFSGGASAGVVDDVGADVTGHRAVMIAHTCAPSCFSTVGPVGQRQTVSPAVNACGARSSRESGSPRSINCGNGKGESLTSPLSIHNLCDSPSPRPRALPILLLPASLSIRRLPSFQLSPAMAPPQPIVVLESLPWTRSTVTPFTLNELVNGRLLTPAE